MKQLVENRQLVVVGRIQEQHPERCRLFMQWQEMDWPIMIDPLNLLELTAVPIVTAIDEYGIGHEIAQENFEAEFIHRDFAPPEQLQDPLVAERPDLNVLKGQTAAGGAETWGEYGAALYLWGGIERIDEAVEAFRQALDLEGGDGRWHFRLGVCLRRRYESEYRKANDFQEAVIEWGRALELDPNQYIWRRRIQQYGPRLDKPYPFYDWTEQAREEITGRGEVPVELTVEPAGAEYAAPLVDLEIGESAVQNPDPDGRIRLDEEGLIQIEVVSVPAVIPPGGSARIHVIFRPNQAVKAHWNNEVEDLKLWVDPLPGWELEQKLHIVKNPSEPVSRETRRLDFELRCASETQPGKVALPAYALYFVCEDVDGTCLFRRQDVRIPLRVR